MAGGVSAVGAELTWESKGMMVLQGKEMLAETNFAVVPGDYFAEVMIWEVGIVTEHVVSTYLMRQTAVAAAGAADNAAVVAFPSPIGLHRLVAANL